MISALPYCVARHNPSIPRSLHCPDTTSVPKGGAMKSNRFLIVATLALMTTSFCLATQKPDDLRVGIGGLIVVDDNAHLHLDKVNPRAGVRGFLRYGFTKRLEGEIGGGIGSVIDQDYQTNIIPFDVRLLLNIGTADEWNPYVYLGAGGIQYEVKNRITGLTNPSKKTALAVGGLGLQVKLSGQLALELSFGDNIVTDKAFNGVTGAVYDGYYTAFVGLSYAGESDRADSDEDGLSNSLEKQLGTDPKKADTDGDGLSDGDEYNKYKTSPTRGDSDGDGLSDGEEVLTYKTDPLKADTDGDGLSDFDELKKYHTDPLKEDTDGDGLKDGDEMVRYKTDPLKSDTDGDGLNDGEEINKYKTDPLRADTDGDGLSDGDEVLKYKTDPLKADTDGGSVNDGTEVQRGTNPLDRADDVPKVEPPKPVVAKPMILEGCEFEPGKADLTKESEDRLTPTVETMLAYPEITIEIRGHTDNTGSRTANVKLSQARAESVKRLLVSKGIVESRITAKGYGPDKPIASNKTTEGKKKNRRVEVVRTK